MSVEVPRPFEGLLIVELCSEISGPYATKLFVDAGAEVIKVEAVHRPDGARRGTPAFYRRLNAHKTVIDLDLRTSEGRRDLEALIGRADIVLEASRPRAMEAFGIDPYEHVARGTVWVSITGYGRTGPASDRVAFGDDAAVAGGLYTRVGEEPWFIGDAAADPIAGVTAAVGALMLWRSGKTGLVDIAMRDAVAHLTGGGPVGNQAL